jgi:lysozyme family protein
MARFNPIASWVIYQEDDHEHPGKVVDLGDGDGRTRLGITERYFLSAVGESFYTTMPFAEAVSTAKRIIRKFFWDEFTGDLVGSDYVAAPILSFAVNASVKHAVEIVQRVLGVQVDGILGDNTLFELNSKDGIMTAKLYRAEWSNYYHKLVDVNVSDERFLEEWLSRVTFPYPAVIPAFYLEAE